MSKTPDRISVVGGFYRERCVWPDVEEEFGSGGRAALALARAEVDINWHYYCPKDHWDRARLILSDERLKHFPADAPERVSFRYVHPLSKPTYVPANLPNLPNLELEDRLVLRFGLMEGAAKVTAEKCIYDPQSAINPVPFQENGSNAEQLAIVLNASEVLSYGEAKKEQDAVQNLVDRENSKVVLVKAGAEGCRVYVDGKPTTTAPAYWVENIYKIGSGDVFSAAFSYHWGINNLPAEVAADNASRCVAHYCDSRTPTVLVGPKEVALKPVPQGSPGQVYIAGPFFTMAELWLIEEAYSALRELGVQPFSPYHDVGIGDPDDVVSKDLEGLRKSTALFAVLDGCDPGTIFEIGYAVKLGIPVVALSQNPKEADLTMLKGSPNCTVTDDFSTAIYKVTWLARR